MLFVRSVKGSSTITSSLTLPEEILKRVEMALIVSSDGEKHISSDFLSISAKAPKKLNRLGHSRLTAGSWGSSTGYILGCSQCLALRLRRSARIGYSHGWSLVPTDPLE